jgi:hypothetical protein
MSSGEKNMNSWKKKKKKTEEKGGIRWKSKINAKRAKIKPKMVRDK